MNYNHMTNKILGWGLVISVGLAFTEGAIGVPNPDYTLLGLLICFFGIWGGIRLIKS